MTVALALVQVQAKTESEAEERLGGDCSVSAAVTLLGSRPEPGTSPLETLRVRALASLNRWSCSKVLSSHNFRYALLVSEENDNEAVAAMKPWSRVLLGLSGTGLSTTGLIAVFAQGTNVAGVPVLIVAGAAFLYVSLTGQQLVQLNKDGFVLSRVAQLEKTLHQATTDPEIPLESKERLAEIAEDNGVRVARLPGVELELRVDEMLRRVGLAKGFRVASPSGRNRRDVDFVLTDDADLKVGVEVKGRMRLRQAADAIRQLRATDWERKLLIVDGGVPEEFAAPYRAEGIWIIAWNPDDESQLVETLKAMGFVKS